MTLADRQGQCARIRREYRGCGRLRGTCGQVAERPGPGGAAWLPNTRL